MKRTLRGLAPLVVLLAAHCGPAGNGGDRDGATTDTRVATDGPARADAAREDATVAPDATDSATPPPPDDAPAMDAPAPPPDAPAMDAPPPPRDVVSIDVPRDTVATDAPRDTVAMDAPRDTSTPVDAGPSSSRQTMRVIGYMSAPNGFYEYLPPGYAPTGGTGSPLLLFWHGIDENGDGTAATLPRVLRNGPPNLISRDAWPASRPFIVLSPQNPPSGCPSAASIRAFLRWAFAHYNIDRARVYLTALSCGAIGSLNYINSYIGDNEITAAVLIAGNGRAAWRTHMCTLGRIGLWMFHGSADEVVNPDDYLYTMTGFPTDDRPDRSRTESERVYAEWTAMGSPRTGGLLACPTAGRRDARLTVYPGVGHNSWGRTYDLSAGHDIYTWLLGMSR